MLQHSRHTHILCTRGHSPYLDGRFADFSDRGGDSKCEMGYLPLDTSKLHAKSSVEFGSPASNHRPMPMVEGQRVSLFYDATAVSTAADTSGGGKDSYADGARMLNATLPTVLKNFPGAREAVIIVENAGAWREYQLVVAEHKNGAPFDVKVVIVGEGWSSNDGTGSGFGEGGSSQTAMGGSRGRGAETRYPLLWADSYCSGKFVLHLDLNSMLLERITYDHIFHLEKPVIPFSRFEDQGEWGSDGEKQSGWKGRVGWWGRGGLIGTESFGVVFRWQKQ